MRARLATSVAVMAMAALGWTPVQAMNTHVDWTAIEAHDDPAIYQIAEGNAVPANLIAVPAWYGTGFQIYAPTRGTIEVTACHMVCYVTRTGKWDLWPQDMIAPLGSSGYFSPGSFGPGNTTIWPQSDTAESAHIPQNRDITRFKPWLYGRVPAIHGTLQLGNWLYLRRGAPVLVLGNRKAAWDSDGYVPVPSPAIFLGIKRNVPISTIDVPDALPMITLPVALLLKCPSCRPGDSGSPVLNRDGRVVAFMDGYDSSTEIADVVPLDPEGYPVGGAPSQPIARAGFHL